MPGAAIPGGAIKQIRHTPLRVEQLDESLMRAYHSCLGAGPATAGSLPQNLADGQTDSQENCTY